MKIDLHIIRQLQEAIAGNSQKAFENLYRLFFPRLYNFSLLYVHKKEAAEEIVNDVMVKIWEKRITINDIDNLETYLFVAVKNHSLNYLNKYSHYHVAIEPESGLAEVINLNDPQKDLEWKEISFKLNLAVEQLPDQCRTVFRLIKEEGFKYRQVAEILGISPRTVETQLFRAIKKLDAVVNIYVEKSSPTKSNNTTLLSLLLAASLFNNFFTTL
ncbi:MAG: RNA polymerase sigma-70 factor [Ferruginibacter sp.]|nr:RNA polymerase sigma-70 factor [Ferruginibacter sp.]